MKQNESNCKTKGPSTKCLDKNKKAGDISNYQLNSTFEISRTKEKKITPRRVDCKK